MKSIHAQYISSFLKSANNSLEKSASYSEIVIFANSLNEKANHLLLRASLNRNINLQHLQRELFETGREYIHKFANKFNQNKNTDKVDESLNGTKKGNHL